MSGSYSRRNLFHLAGAAAATMLGSRIVPAQQQKQPLTDAQMKEAMKGFLQTNPEPFPALQTRSAVAIIQGDIRRKMIYESLLAVDDQIRPEQ